MMTATKPEVIRIGGWRAIPNELGGYDIHSPGSYDTYRGYAPTEEQARQWLDESSGAAYARLPAVKESELRVVHGKSLRLPEFPCRGRYRTNLYYLGDKLLGSIQTKTRTIKGCTRVEVLTGVGGSCVRGHDLRWLLKENGLRLIEG